MCNTEEDVKHQNLEKKVCSLAQLLGSIYMKHIIHKSHENIKQFYSNAHALKTHRKVCNIQIATRKINALRLYLHTISNTQSPDWLMHTMSVLMADNSHLLT